MRFLGNTDEVNVCDCCGRKDLKGTVAIENESGDVVHYGVVCAAKALKTSAKVVRQEAKRADDDKKQAIEAARRAAWDAEDKLWQAFLDKMAPNCIDFDGKPNRCNQIQFLGGYGAAKAAYRKQKGN